MFVCVLRVVVCCVCAFFFFVVLSVRYCCLLLFGFVGLCCFMLVAVWLFFLFLMVDYCVSECCCLHLHVLLNVAVTCGV